VARDLSTKGLAGRLHAEYAAERPFRRRLFFFTGLCVLVMGGLWAARAALGPPDDMFQPGPVAHVHQHIARDCMACHDTRRSTPDTKCQVCHNSPEHNPSISERLKHKPPACAQCHVEHKGGTQVVPTADQRCVQCHGKLARADADRTSYTNTITSFAGDHPEFAILRKPDQDPAQLKFNHRFHLNKKARDEAIGSAAAAWPTLVAKFLSQGKIEREGAAAGELACTDCHLMDPASGHLMQPIKYEQHCSSCHALEYDLEQRAVGKTARDRLPHAAPQEIHRYLVAQFTAQRDATGGLPQNAAARGVLRPGNSARPPSASVLRQAADWVDSRVGDVERGLAASGRCAQCHVVKIENPELPVTSLSRLSVVPTGIKPSWFTHAQFSHISHRTMACESCHVDVRSSDQTSKVNLPSIKACQGCHTAQGGSRSDCAEFHAYHDRQGRVRNEGKIRELPNRNVR
jgi:hypothetical protein